MTDPINLNGRTRLYPLLGDPIIYARSPDWLSKHMAKRGMNMISLPMEVPDGKLKVVMDGLAATGNVDGLSLTMPHKITTVAVLDEPSTTVKVAGSCNAVRPGPGGRLAGDMFDGEGFVTEQSRPSWIVRLAHFLGV